MGDLGLAPWVPLLDARDEGYALAMEVGENRADGEAERDIARRLGVKRGQLRMWLKDSPERWAAYSAALESRADELVDETIGIADNDTGDPARDALRIRVRQWYAERANRAGWGNTSGTGVQITPGSGMPTQINVVFVDASDGRPREKLVDG